MARPLQALTRRVLILVLVEDGLRELDRKFKGEEGDTS